MGRASPYEGSQVDCVGGYLASGDVDVSYCSNGGGHGRKVVKGGYEDDKSTDGGNRG